MPQPSELANSYKATKLEEGGLFPPKVDKYIMGILFQEVPYDDLFIPHYWFKNITD